MLTTIVGPMYSSKTETLLSLVRRAQHAKRRVVLIKPSIDNRYALDEIVSHAGRRIKAKVIPAYGHQLLDALVAEAPKSSDDRVLYAVDEIQFFAGNASFYLPTLRKMALVSDIVVSGLDLDFRGEPFPVVKEILAVSDTILKLTAICDVCGNDARRTQRVVDGEPETDGDVVAVGGAEMYQARCLECFVGPSEEVKS